MKDAPTFAARHAALVHALQQLRDPQERLSWIVEQARVAPPFNPEWRTPERILPGCAARLWLVAERARDRCRFACDSDSAILKAIAGLLCTLYDGLPPAEVVPNEPEFLRATGIMRHLTENRRKTILRVRDAIRQFAEGAEA